MTEILTPAQYREQIASDRKPSKYRNKPVILDGKRFASQREGRRYRELSLLEKGGAIRSLQTQVPFLITVAENRICKYVADFFYIEGGKQVAEDSKGLQTPTFKLKWKLCQALYPQITWRLS